MAHYYPVILYSYNPSLKKNPIGQATGFYQKLREILYGSTFLDGFLRVVFLTAQPIQNGYERKHDTNPVHRRTNRINDVFEGPLEAVGYRLKDALKVHG